MRRRFGSTNKAVEETPENSEDAKRAKRIIYWVAGVFIVLPLIVYVVMFSS